jgi:DNA recombination protein RmuC
MEIVLGVLIGAVLVGGIAFVAWRASLARRPEPVAPEEVARRLAEEQRRANLEEQERFRTSMLDQFQRMNQEVLDRDRRLAASELDSRKELIDQRLDQRLGEVSTAVRTVSETVHRLEEDRKHAFGGLERQLRMMHETQETLRTETGNLVTALRAPHVRGRWGEIQLKRVIELAGMVEHCDFHEQQTTTDADGNVLRPDVVVHLPGDKHVVIDAKVPLVAYLDAFRDDVTESERRAFLADHARHVREHVQKLSQKAYWRQLPGTPELVIMFLPDETFMRAALEHDSSLSELAWSNNVIPASPTNLIGLLRAMHYGWQQETIAESAREVSELGRELYKRLSTMGVHVSKLGRSLDGAVKAYNETVGSLERQVLVQARRFERHGITGVEPPELQPIERQTRPLAAAELVEPGEQTALEAVAAGNDAA